MCLLGPKFSTSYLVPTSQGRNTLAGIQGLIGLVPTKALNTSWSQASNILSLTQWAHPFLFLRFTQQAITPNCSQQSLHHPILSQPSTLSSI